MAGIASFRDGAPNAGTAIVYGDGVLFFGEADGVVLELSLVCQYDQAGYLEWASEEWRQWVWNSAPQLSSPDDSEISVNGVLVFDTETSDRPRNWNAPASDVDNWPRLLQLAFIVCDHDLQPLRVYSNLVRPDGWVVASGAARVHGITTEMASAEGVPLADVLTVFERELNVCGVVVAHNLKFDEAVMRAEYSRAHMDHSFGDVNGLCTMQATTELCKLGPRRNGEYKWPKLSELHEICVGYPHEGAHDAMGDAEAVLRCMQVLQRAGNLTIATE